MKKALLLLNICVMVFAACSSDNEETQANDDTIVGHWVSVSRHSKTIFIETDEIYNEWDDTGDNLSIKLYQDGTCSRQSIYGGPYLGSYKLLGNELDLFITSNSGNTSTFNYVIENYGKDSMVLYYESKGRMWQEQYQQSMYTKTEEHITMQRK